MSSTMFCRARGQTHIGRVRTSNQDSMLVDEPLGLFIVADGMGGHAGGEVASQLCVEKIKEFVLSHTTPKDLKDNASLLGRAVNHASSRIYERALEEPYLKGMGTTATALQIRDGMAYCAHVGDSRLYLVRCGLIYQLTYDHSLVSEQIRAGVLSPEDAQTHHLRNVITRSVGYQEEEEVDILSFSMEPDDIIVLSSDGLHGKITEQEISLKVQELQLDAVTNMVDLANERGGEDNITVIVVEVKV